MGLLRLPVVPEITKLCASPAPSGYFTALRAPSGPDAWYVLAFSGPQMTAQGRQTATGGSAMKAVEVIMEHGVPEDRIIFINLVGVRLLPLSYFGMSSCGERAQISAPEGLKRFAARYPSLRVVCCVSRQFRLAQSLTGDSFSGHRMD